MRSIGPEWRKLAEGLQRVETLEAQFRAEWGSQLDATRRKKTEAEKQKFRRRGRRALAAVSLLALLLLAVALVLILTSPAATAVVFVLALVVPAVPAFYGVWALRYNPELLPDPSDLANRWWDTISRGAISVRDSAPTLAARRYGDEGEVAFILYLIGELPDEYITVRGLLVARHLDADVLVAGPTGIWVYEVKHWSGQITCLDGQWRRVKTYHGPGGRLVQEHEVLKPFDKQWIKEANAVKETLRRRVPQCPGLHDAVGGGLVFTHGGVSFFADGACRAWIYTPRSCVEALSSSSEIPAFTMQRRLHAIDALD